MEQVAANARPSASAALTAIVPTGFATTISNASNAPPIAIAPMIAAPAGAAVSAIIAGPAPVNAPVPAPPIVVVPPTCARSLAILKPTIIAPSRTGPVAAPVRREPLANVPVVVVIVCPAVKMSVRHHMTADLVRSAATILTWDITSACPIPRISSA